jgi:hypothetical protein
MAHYHFDLIDGCTLADEGGRDLADDIAAADEADRMASELYKDRPELRGKDYAISATNLEGEEVHRAPIDHRSPPFARSGATLIR